MEHRYSLDVIVTRKYGEQPPRTKADAVKWRDRLRTDIRNGGFDAPNVDATASLTFGDVCGHYLARHVRDPLRRRQAIKQMEDHIRLARTTEVPAHGGLVLLESKPIASVTQADMEALREARIQASRAFCVATKRRHVKQGEVGANRLLERIRHLFTWAIEKGYVTETPFRRAHVPVVRPNRKAETRRSRRLVGDEETRLLAAAGPHLYAVIVAALTTGCRRGELLTMQWHQVRSAEIILPAAKTKTAEARSVPVTSRLRGVLSMRRQAPDGRNHTPDAYVFGDEVGGQIKDVKTAWGAACRRAGITDLHFHDLRRECGSRWVEAGVSLVQVQAWLGHTNISQTSTYLRVSPAGTDEALRRIEAFDSARFAHDSHNAVERIDLAHAAEAPQRVVM